MKQKLTGEGKAVIVTFRGMVFAPDGVSCRAALGPAWLADDLEVFGGEVGGLVTLLIIGEERRQITVPMANVVGISEWRHSSGDASRSVNLEAWRKARRLEGMYCGVFELSEWGLA